MSIGIVYIALMLSVYVTNTCGLRNVVRASKQVAQSSLCDENPRDTMPVVSAVLVECPKEPPKKPAPSFQSEAQATHCEDQLMINIRVNPSFQTEKSEKFLILDEVYDSRKRTKAKILSPYLIEISRGEPIMMYPLQFTKSVKSDDLCPKKPEVKKGKCQLSGANVLSNPNNPTHKGGLEKNSPNSADAFLGAENRYPYKGVDEENVRKVVGVNNKSYKKAVSEAELSPDIGMVYDDYGSEDDDREEPLELKVQPSVGNSREQNPYMSMNDDVNLQSQPADEYLDEEEEDGTHEDNNSADRECQQPSLATVGILSELNDKLENSKMAQVGVVKSSRDNEEAPAELSDHGERNLMIQRVDNQAQNWNKDNGKLISAHRPSQSAKEDDMYEDYTSPEKDVGLLHEVAEIHTNDDTAEYNDEVDPSSFVQLSLANRKSHSLFGKGRGGSPRKQRPRKLKGPRKIDPPEEVSDVDMNDYDEGEYYEELNNIAENDDKSGVMAQNDQNTKDESDSFDEYEEEDGKNLTPRLSEGSLDYIEENEDENSEEVEKQYTPLRKKLSYISENRPREEETMQVGFGKRNENPHKGGTGKIRSKSALAGRYNHRMDFRLRNSDRINHANNVLDRSLADRAHFGPKKNTDYRSWGHHNTFGHPKKITDQRIATDVSTESFLNMFNYNVVKDLNEGNHNNKASFENNFNKNDMNSERNYDTDEDMRSSNPPLREDNHKSNYNNQQGNRRFGKPPAILQSPRSQARLLLDSEPPRFLPKMPPYARIIEDPHLNLDDKMGVMNIIEPRSEKTENGYNRLSNEVLDSYIVHPTPPLFPLITTKSSDQEIIDNSKAKRSYVLYDDLETRNTLLDNDYNFDDTYQHGAPPGTLNRISEDPAPCDTCGGKGKKAPHKTPTFNLQDNPCRCRTQRTAFEPGKGTHSVSDAWYAVFNMSAPLPFLTTEVRVFRKRRKTWWQIAPSITLNSLSGIFANANLSILFSSHVDIFQLERALQLQNHQLLIPKDNRPARQNQNKEMTTADIVAQNLKSLNVNPSNILAIDNTKFNWNSTPAKATSGNNGWLEEETVVESRLGDKYDPSLRSTRAGKSKHKTNKKQNTNQTDANYPDGVESNDGVVRTIGELGYFPTSMNLLERCPNDKNRLCLNMLEDRVPAYTIKVKLPFRENTLLFRNITRVKISKIVTDATTKDVLQVSIDVINEGVIINAFAVSVCNCPLVDAGAKNSEQRLLAPRAVETFTFLLPLIQESHRKHKKLYCDVLVEDMAETRMAAAALNMAVRAQRKIKPQIIKVVSVRSLTIEVDHRCFCIWDCKCHCVPKLESYVNMKACQKLSKAESIKAGMLHCEDGDKSCLGMVNNSKRSEQYEFRGRFGWLRWLLHHALLFILILLLLGFLKALVGRCGVKKVDSWGYSYVQPGCRYEDSSRSRRFFVNTIFFLVFPFLFWCKCFTPSEEDLLVASTEWQCSLTQDTYRDSEEDGNGRCDYTMSRSVDEEEEEDAILSKSTEGKTNSSGSYSRSRGGEDFMNLDARISDWSLALKEGAFDDEDDEDEEANTKFVLQALVESRESLKKLLRGHSSQKLDMEENPQAKEAKELVESLKKAKIVYRVFDRPLGSVRSIPLGTRYCIQGYFLPSLGTAYEFVNYIPLVQYCCYNSKGSLEDLRPPVNLCHQELCRKYKNKLDILEAGDLYVHPPPSVPCINITSMTFVASSVVKLASGQSCRSHSCQSHFSKAATESANNFTPQSHHPLRRCKEANDMKDSDQPTNSDQPTTSQLLRNISAVNDEMMNETSNLPEEESIESTDNSSVEIYTNRSERPEEEAGLSNTN